MNNMFLYNMDCLISNKYNINKYYIGSQTFFFDLQLLVEFNFKNKIDSLSKIYSGNTWIERELKESNDVFFLDLLDNRKLLSNYNYNFTLEYNHYNSIINDIKI
jgi:Ni,Fe-hydrogenase III component G